METETIAAISTALGEGGIGIVRISGVQALEIARRIFRLRDGSVLEAPVSHRAVYGKVIDPGTGAVVDEALLLFMQAPRSYTCEDVVELQCHGGALPLRKVLSLALSSGARLAEPGEFTKRAFLNGRLDLSQAQAVMDVIHAKTEASLRMAAGHLEGAFSKRIRACRDEILRYIAQIEAKIDFPEDDVADLEDTEIVEAVQTRADEMDELLATAHTGRILRDGLKTVLAGRPNVGKSSLLNALLQEERAIVTDIPGTTRDAIEEYVNLGGVPLRIVDTAGIRATDNPIEKIGVQKSRAFIERADLILLLLDGTQPLEAADAELLASVDTRRAIVLLTKADLPQRIDCKSVAERVPQAEILRVSSKTGEGLKALEQRIFELAYGGNRVEAEAYYLQDVRQEEILRQARVHLMEVVRTFENGLTQDFLVIDLRAAWEKLGEITGDTVHPAILDEIFSRFCIGK